LNRGGGQTLHFVCGLVICLASAYLVVGCTVCNEGVTGLPTLLSKALSWSGVLFGISLSLASLPWKGTTQGRARVTAGLMIAACGVGALLLFGIVASVYTACPVCTLIWSTVALASLACVAQGGREGAAVSTLLVVTALAAAWMRFDRTAAYELASLLPRAPLVSDCVSEVLTGEDVENLTRLGLPERRPILFVTNCSPCVAQSLARAVRSQPDFTVVATDSTLVPVVGAQRLIQYPQLAQKAAILKGNLYEATVSGGRIVACKAKLDL
jgi:hypothetical protein